MGERPGLEVDVRQTNHEGVLLDWLNAAADSATPVVLNAAAWTHYSYALLDACAGHDTRELLCSSTPYGWFVFACEERPQISDTLWALFEEARQHGCEYLLFDRDAAGLEGFPVFDWEADQTATRQLEKGELMKAG